MSEQIIALLRTKLDDLAASGEIDPVVRRNCLKEELQFFVLNFIYHHPAYNSWIMYGGSALRIIHKLDRMSVDLDFEVPHAITPTFLEELKQEIANHFISTYAVAPDFLHISSTGRGLLLKFNIGDDLNLGHPSKQVHIKIDLNHFVAPKTVTERRPINQDQFSFVIVTYNMSALMASKIAALFLRGKRGVGGAIYEEKGRDIYDLLWYMSKKVVPDLDYLAAKGINMGDPRTLFDRLTVQTINNVSDENLHQDLLPLFVNRTFIENWLLHWKESYFRLLDDYEIHTVTDLEHIIVHRDFPADNYSFIYYYYTEEGTSVRIMYTVSEYWMIFRDGELPIQIDEKLVNKIRLTSDSVSSQADPIDRIRQYTTLFHQKTETYLKKINRVMLGNQIVTKVIRMTADKLNQKEQIVLNKSALLTCDLDDLLK